MGQRLPDGQTKVVSTQCALLFLLKNAYYQTNIRAQAIRTSQQNSQGPLAFEMYKASA
jgi:hypothetical protein